MTTPSQKVTKRVKYKLDPGTNDTWVIIWYEKDGNVVKREPPSIYLTEAQKVQLAYRGFL